MCDKQTSFVKRCYSRGNNSNMRKYRQNTKKPRPAPASARNGPVTIDSLYRAAGIIPYALVDGEMKFLFQRYVNPRKKNDIGWTDFGGKINNVDRSAHETASREFSEETCCVFYLNELDDIDTKDNIIKKIEDVPFENRESYQKIMKEIIPESISHFSLKLKNANAPYIYNGKKYVCYLMKVNYIPETDIPQFEDMHIDYDDRYYRECKWFSLAELKKLDKWSFHRRLHNANLLGHISCLV